MGSESLNWRSTEPEMPPMEYNTEPARNQTHMPPQVTSTSVGPASKVETVADHQDYVAYLRTGKQDVGYLQCILSFIDWQYFA